MQLLYKLSLIYTLRDCSKSLQLTLINQFLMAEFISEDRLNTELIQLIYNAQEQIILISPYIKLHEKIKVALNLKLRDPAVSLIIVFGKNEDNLEKSLGRQDLDFFKTLPNVILLYNHRLHAKYYASESTAILTSMNLYEFSQNNNIEVGILMRPNRLSSLASGITGGETLDTAAYNYFASRVINQSIILYNREPIIKKKLFGLSETYEGSTVNIDETERYFKGESISAYYYKDRKSSISPDNLASAKIGYCIRTGSQIPFNVKHPLSSEAYKSWSRFSNAEYPEKFCHFSGEPSNGETTFSKPIMKKNWSKAKETHSL